jgi:hypothetical protein
MPARCFQPSLQDGRVIRRFQALRAWGHSRSAAGTLSLICLMVRIGWKERETSLRLDVAFSNDLTEQGCHAWPD